MDNGMEAMLETYLYETNSLLDALDAVSYTHLRAHETF